MTSDEVYKLIEDNGLNLHGDIEHFAELVRVDEREVCASLAEKLTWADNEGVASAIRARSNT